MDTPATDTLYPKAPRWDGDGTSRIPFAAYTDADLHKRELERFFYRGHWCYVGLEAEIPNPGDFKRTAVGERSVIVVRDEDGAVHVVENVCAHRGMAFCRARHGTVKEFVCPYHQWNYSLKGDLQGVPFRRGVKQDGKVQGGMPADFRTEDHGLNKLQVAVRGGVVFASFDADVEPLEDFLGPAIVPWFDRLFDGRPLRILGYNRQRIPGNWKLMQENIKDPYHPGLLHTWFVTFGLWRADNRSQLVMDARHRHAAMISTRGQSGKSAQVTQVSSFKENMQLEDPRFLDIVAEPWWKGPTAVMTTIFPSVILQQQVNSVSTRHIQPDGHGAFDFVWTHFGFADDMALVVRVVEQGFADAVDPVSQHALALERQRRQRKAALVVLARDEPVAAGVDEELRPEVPVARIDGAGVVGVELDQVVVLGELHGRVRLRSAQRSMTSRQ